MSCFDFLLLKSMLKRRGCVGTPAFVPWGPGCRHYQGRERQWWKHQELQWIFRETNSSTYRRASGFTPGSYFLLFRSLITSYAPLSTSYAAMLTTSIAYFYYLESFLQTSITKIPSARCSPDALAQDGVFHPCDKLRLSQRFSSRTDNTFSLRLSSTIKQLQKITGYESSLYCSLC